MSNDTTTISITTEQKAQLDEKKQHERESYKSVIGRLLEGESERREAPSQVIELSEASEEELEQMREGIRKLQTLVERVPEDTAERFQQFR